MPFRFSPNGDLVWVSPGTPAADGEEDLTLADIEDLINKAVDGNLATTSQSVSSSTSNRQTTSTKTSITEQISKRFFDVPTPEEFLNDFEVAYGGFLEGMRESGLGSSQIALALDPATGLMDSLMAEYMGGLAERANAGEDIFGLVGTEEDFELLRTEPGTESITKGKDKSVTTEQEKTSGSSVSDSGASSTRAGSSSGKSTSEGTSESIFKEKTQVFSRPKIASVFKFSPTDFLEERFHGDAGELATFVESEKGVRQRQRQTLGGGTVVQGRQS